MNKTKLDNLIQKVENIKFKDTMCEDKWIPFTTALQAAKDVSANVRASQKEIDDAYTALKTAAIGIVNPHRLKTKMDKAEKIDKRHYTEESYEKVVAALNDSKSELDTEIVDQEILDNAETALENAVNELVEKPPISRDMKDRMEAFHYLR